MMQRQYGSGDKDLKKDEPTLVFYKLQYNAGPS